MNDFSDILTIIRKVRTIVGIPILDEGESPNKTFWEKLFRYTVPFHIFMIFVLFHTTLYLSNFSSISIIITCSTVMLITCLILALRDLERDKKIIASLFEWCAQLHNIETKFHKLVQPIAKIYIPKAHKLSKIVLVRMSIILAVDVFAINFGFFIIGQFLPDTIYPKYGLPTPFYLPCKNQETYSCVFATLMVVSKVSIDLATFGLLIFGMIFCLAIYLYNYLDIIMQFIELLGRKIEEEFIEENGCEENKIVKVNGFFPSESSQERMDIMMEIMEQSLNEKLDFDLWMNLIVKMIEDVNGVITQIKQLFYYFFLWLETSSLCSILIFGLIFMVVKTQYFYGFGIMIILLLFFCVCYISEKLLEKLNAVSNALYSIPWYYITPKQRKLLILALPCNMIQGGFTAAGVHPLTLNRFLKTIQAGYTNCLVLKDVVK